MGWSSGVSFEQPDEEAVIEAMDAGVPYTAGELYREVRELSREQVRARLRKLCEDGRVAEKRHSYKRVTYYIPSEGMARPRGDV